MSLFQPRWFGGPPPATANADSYGSGQDGWLAEYKVVSRGRIWFRLYRPASPRGDYIEYLGHWDSDGATPYKDRALPRGAATIVVDVGPRQHLSVYAADGDTRLTVPPAFVAGPHAGSYVTDIVAATGAS